MKRYPPIAEHGMVGDLQTAALVSSEGVVDWFAAPRFDSPSLFAALLDHDRGGYYRLGVDHPQATAKQLYYPDSATLVTRFSTPDGLGEVIDWMTPLAGVPATDRHTLYRVVRVMRGTVTFTVECRPRFDYARATHKLNLNGDDAVFEAPDTTAHLQSYRIPIELDGQDVRGEVTLRTGETAGLALTVCEPGGAAPARFSDTAEVAERAWADIEFWQSWLRNSTYRGRWPGMVHRSAITLKLLTYEPSGAPVAAATMGLPEEIGGERNWDYRYTWVRDGSLSVRALLDLGFVDEGMAFAKWMAARLRDGLKRGGEPLQIMYRVDGDPELDEFVLEHFEGYQGSAPVRVGNAAADQLQLDIYGEAMFAFAEASRFGRGPAQAGWNAIRQTVDWLATAWDRPDEGIWETRGGREDFTYSRVMSWVAFDRAISMATEFRRPGDIAGWTAARDTVLEQILAKGWSEKEQALVQHYRTDHIMDASLLLVPMVGLLVPTDPAWQSTLDAIDRHLVSDSLVYRYDPELSPDGLEGGEGTFSLCSYLYVDALAQAGRLREARYAFDKMQTYANHVGLFAEEIGQHGEQLGNFPQAFTHLALIMAALTLDKALDAANAGRVSNT
ncbi:glycoside hydrolase family 15 protein [Actinospica robiniae]|uniref:glycoside hydrolase family 15 protein n=1 Tax=Actinospica robiniae TaxID=304901 RepID=UPI0005503A78|nr:glycoside hydrolase family 15 protein [Actinospica robiniae]